MKIDEIKKGAIYTFPKAPTMETCVMRCSHIVNLMEGGRNKRLPIFITYQGKEIPLPQSYIEKATNSEVIAFLAAIRLVENNLQSTASQTIQACFNKEN
jgi:hypothetical protein